MACFGWLTGAAGICEKPGTTMPSVTHAHPYLSDHDFVCFAHRGGGVEGPENANSTFAAAVKLGYRFIETDVQATSDGALMVFHDDALDPLTDGEGIIAELPLAEVCQAKIGDTESLMTLEEALVEFPDTRFNIDIKTEQALRPTLELVRRMNCFDRVCLASFSDDRLARIRSELGSVACIGAGPRDVTALKFSSWGIPFMRSSAHCAQVPLVEYGITIVTRRFVRYCHRRGVAVHVWTIDDPDEMRRLIRLGVHGIMTDP
jgi:glycerophosphoryl diester phosphodiesterase